MIMRRLILSAIFTCLALGSLNAQKMGEIEVNRDFTATLNFSDDILLTVTGNNPQVGIENDIPKYKYYGIFQSGSAVIIRGVDPAAPATSITIKLKNGKIWYGTLKYGNNTKIYYDFADQDSRIEKKEAKQLKDSLEKEQMKIVERLNFVMNKAQEYNDIGIEANKMEFGVANIENDDKYTYFKLTILNGTGSDYKIDNVIFKYVEGKKKGFKKSDAKIEERINPVIEPDDTSKIIKGYSSAVIGYVIPLFTVGSEGKLLIQIVEKNGTRNPLIEIEAKTMLKVKKM